MKKHSIYASLMMLLVAVTACLLTACSQPAKPEVDIGERTSKISMWDGEKANRKTVSAAHVAAGSPTAPFTVTRTYGHGAKDVEQIYRVPETKQADWVASQKKYMIWSDGKLYAFSDPYDIQVLPGKPEVVLTTTPDNLSRFSEDLSGRSFEVGRQSYDGSTIPVSALRRYVRETTYVREVCKASTNTVAERVESQNGWMFFIGNQLYIVRADRNVQWLSSKPEVDLGIRHDMISGQDSEDKSKRVVKAIGWSLDKRHLVVQSEQHFSHETRFENEVYTVERQKDAYKSSTYNCWAADVDGDLYLFDIEGCRSQNTSGSTVRYGDVKEELRPKNRECTPKSPQPEQPAEKAEVNIGRQTEKIQNFDKENLDKRKVTPLKLNDDNTYAVMVTRHYVNVSKTELTKYYIQKQLDAKYDASKRGYVLEVGKDTYVISKSGKMRQL